jgi:hypothetical protein
MQAFKLPCLSWRIEELFIDKAKEWLSLIKKKDSAAIVERMEQQG